MKNRFRKIEDPNPLDFFGVRQLSVAPPHFEYIDIDTFSYNIEGTIIKWITENLRGRFYVGNGKILDSENQYKKVVKIGFEEPKELSFFTLACPYLKYK